MPALIYMLALYGVAVIAFVGFRLLERSQGMDLKMITTRYQRIKGSMSCWAMATRTRIESPEQRRMLRERGGREGCLT